MRQFRIKLHEVHDYVKMKRDDELVDGMKIAAICKFSAAGYARVTLIKEIENAN